jgi:hypothetical protein
LIGGSNNISNSLRVIEHIDTATLPASYTKTNCKLIPGRSSFGAVGNICASSSYIYIAGGITSGRNEDFLTINVEALPGSVKLQGISTAALDILAQDENGDSPETVDVQVQGYLSISDPSPTLFRKDRITLRDGQGVAILYPRSDDITNKDNSPLTMQSGTLRTYKITAQASIIDGIYSGQTDNDLSPEATSPGNTISSNITPVSLDGSDIVVTNYPTVNLFEKTDVGGVIQGSLNGLFDFSPKVFSSGNSAEFNYFSDFNWIPQVQALINDNEGSYERLSDGLLRLQNNVPFGASPIFDAVDIAATTLSIDNTGRKKILYISSDGDENGSKNTIDQAINNLQSVDGARDVPTIASYVNIVPSSMKLSKGRRVASNAMVQIAEANNGSSFDITSDADVQAAIDFAISGGPGSIGYGTYECIKDLGEISPLDQATAYFDLPAETSASWRISVSKDNLSYFDYTDALLPNVSWALNEREARYVKFSAILQSTYKPSEYNADSIYTPSLTNYQFTYNKSSTSYLFLTPTSTDDYANQIAVTLDTNIPTMSSINIGATTSDSTDWEYYFNASQGYVSQSGKIIIPVRRKVTDNSSIEPLDKIDSFAFEARYGSWDSAATIDVLDSAGNSVDASTYSTSPDLGYIVFNTKQAGSYFLSVTNSTNLLIGAKITNRLATEPVLIRGAGYMWTTTKQRDIVTTALLQSFNLCLLPFNPNENSVFVATYAFFDASGREEDTAKTQIKWYKIGFDSKEVYLDSLDNILTWDNKIYNLLQPGETVYFTVRPSNGVQYGAIVKSFSSTVSSDSSIRATNLQLLPTNPTPNSILVAIYDYSNTAGKAEKGTQIRWYKNGNLIPALNDLTTFDNTGTPSANLVARDTIYFTVRPSDGTSYGALVKSTVLTVSSS